MFAHATSRTSRTAASSIRSIGADRPLTSSCSDTRDRGIGAVRVGMLVAEAPANRGRSSAACAAVTPGLRRRPLGGIPARGCSAADPSPANRARRRRRRGRATRNRSAGRRRWRSCRRSGRWTSPPRRGSAEQPLPHAVADQRDGAVLVIPLERAAKLDLRTGNVEIVRRHAHPGEPLGVAAAGEVRAPSEERGNRRQRVGGLLEVGRDRGATAAVDPFPGARS